MVPEPTRQELESATDAAAKAYPSWRLTPLSTRVRYMFKLVELLNKNKDEIAKSITEEQGKTLVDAHGDLFRGIEVAEHSCSTGTLLMGETLENLSRHIDTYSFRQPLGVFAGICPFNFPVNFYFFSLFLITTITPFLRCDFLNLLDLFIDIKTN